MDRRAFLKMAAVVGAGAMLPLPKWTAMAQSGPKNQLAKFPEKTDLILLTDRPPQLETPLKYFREDLTPNEAFFVRWHEAGIPTEVDEDKFRLMIGGHVDSPLSLSLDDLKKQFEPVSTVAVAQCSGNSRSLYQPRVTGGQWGHGAVGNAKWTGVKLKDLLNKAGMKADAVEVSFQGLDRPPIADTPAFAKALEAGRAMDGEVMVAYQMNGADLPMLNGYPLRLVVPGWYATYWVKSLQNINVLPEKFKSFWMDKAYRVPNNPEAQETPQALATDTVPITTMSVRSLIVRPEPQEEIRAGQPAEIEGLAMDSGKGIKKVEVSTDGGKSWSEARLEKDLGNYSWRRWKMQWNPANRGPVQIMARATNAAGEGQGTYQWNRSGYRRNVIEHVDVTVV